METKRALTEEEQKQARAEWDSLFARIKRPGKEKLLRFLQKTDYFTAPASTKFHSSVPGGLMFHSVNMAKALLEKKREYVNRGGRYQEMFQKIPDESMIIIGLFHDLSKVEYYSVQMRNRKIDGEWQQVPFYMVDDQIPLGKAEKSVIMLSQFMRLTREEVYAIRWHRAFAEDKANYGVLSEAMRMHPLIIATMEADIEAMYIDERDIGTSDT